MTEMNDEKSTKSEEGIQYAEPSFLEHDSTVQAERKKCISIFREAFETKQRTSIFERAGSEEDAQNKREFNKIPGMTEMNDEKSTKSEEG
ncbi:hypothetical protein CDAR_55101 [Caerostris darwini]|uniref:Uncharacterized protein n=1 Tax=Caerostris darwini TaxID=1538125 RepID=A0AAV4PFP9_9ARAC|nr:hypothetical protein CDAR_55101 [Caerostris darwini]